MAGVKHRKTIVTAAITGNQTTVAQHPGLPCAPEQIAVSAIDSAKAGAAIVHIHVRHPDGRPSMELAHYREVVDRIRNGPVDVIINLTTGPGQRFIPSEHDPRTPAPGSTLMHPLKRIEHIVELKPELCSLDLNTMWSGSSVVINTPQTIQAMAEAIYGAGVKPELEVFDSGDMHLAAALIENGVLEKRPLFQIVCGVRYGFAATPSALAYARSLVPRDCEWASFGIGRMAFPFVAQSFLLGGHVRVGLEDSVQVRKGVLAPSNAAMVEKAVHLIDELGGEVATAREARDILGLATKPVRSKHHEQREPAS
jgi:uncharacterized protein (DUF849 family)